MGWDAFFMHCIFLLTQDAAHARVGAINLPYSI